MTPDSKNDDGIDPTTASTSDPEDADLTDDADPEDVMGDDEPGAGGSAP